jgi:hypothetical protein
MSASEPMAYLNVFTVKKFQTKEGETARKWTLIGVAFPHTDGLGFNLELQCVPLDGKLVALPPNADGRAAESSHNGANGQLPLSPPHTSEPARAHSDRTPARESRTQSRDRRR